MLIHVYRCHGNMARLNVCNRPITTGLFASVALWILWSVMQAKNNTQEFTLEESPLSKRPIDIEGLRKALLQRADRNGYIIVLTFDDVYLEMAQNFYLTSLKKFKIENYLFLTTDSYATEVLQKENISAFTLFDEPDKGVSPAQTFRQNTNYKIIGVLAALELNLTVLVNDVDIIYLQNPLPYLFCLSCDLLMTADVTVPGNVIENQYNTGFYLARPTKLSKALHRTVFARAFHHSTAFNQSNQQIVNHIIREMHPIANLNIVILRKDKFVNGHNFLFRYFPKELKPRNWLVFHNNWLSSFSAKRYRFKEYKMWMVDTNKYYSSHTDGYITYSNPIDFGMYRTPNEEEKALKNAFFLALLLDRIVILPKFHCYLTLRDIATNTKLDEYKTKLCNYMGNYAINQLDLRMEYRENVFLEHMLVPSIVKLSTTSSILIDNYTKEFSDYESTFSSANIRLSVKRKQTGQINTNNLLRQIEKYSKFKVLTFHSLYGDLLPRGDRHFDYHMYRVESAIKRIRWQ